MGFPTSHQPRFYAAPNFLKMGIKYLNLSYFIQVSTIKDDKYAAKFHYILAATLRWFTAVVQSASLYDNFRKHGNYVIDDAITWKL